MKKILALAMITLLCLACLCSCSGKKFNANIGIDTTDHKLHDVEIVIENYGTITLTLDETIAPITVNNFIKLANEGFYDGTVFHRIIEDFMMQGGAPKSGESTPDTIKGEFANNGIKNPLPHVRGVISMARTSVKDSASSQFFIVHEDSPHLNGDYAAFGWVTSGIDVVDKICENTPVIDRNGTVLPADRPVITSIRVITD